MRFTILYGVIMTESDKIKFAINVILDALGKSTFGGPSKFNGYKTEQERLDALEKIRELFK